MKKEDIAWAAGFIDGEGTIGVYRHRDHKKGSWYFEPLVQASNTDRVPLLKLKRLFGGNVVIVTHNHIDPLSHYSIKDCFHWKVVYRRAFWVAKLILPYLTTVKRYRAIDLIRFYEAQVPRRRDYHGRYVERESLSPWIVEPPFTAGSSKFTD
jgi:hypothetical protein